MTQRELIFFESLGLKVLRFWNSEINANLEGAMVGILEFCEQTNPTSNSSPFKKGEEGTTTNKN